MKKFFLVILIITFAFYINAQDSTDLLAEDLTVDVDENYDNDSEIELKELQNQLTAIKKDIDILKKRTEWFTLKFEGSIKTIWGANLWARLNSKNEPYFDQNIPITSGFDFENNLRFTMNLGNKIVANSTSEGDKGTEVVLALTIKSLGISQIQPRGSWYVVDAKDDQDNQVEIYFPRFERGSSNILFGNLQIAIDEAKVKNIIGSGFFINYQDVMEVHQYYGIRGMVDVMKLNHEYFNNGYVKEDTTGDIQYASLYYSFDPKDYEPKSEIAEAVKIWSNSMLRIDPADSDYNQKPHGISFGFDKKLSEGFHFYIEAGASSKDAFDPKYFEDYNIDYGFFVKTEPKFFINDKFNFHPKLGLSIALETETTTDVTEKADTEWSTFGAGLSLPFEFILPSGKKDKIKLEFNCNLNVFIKYAQVATMVSFFPEFTLLNNKLFFSMPIIYSFKNADRGGFFRAGHEDIKWLDQLYDDHILNLGFTLGFDSQKLFGHTFQYRVTNSIYFTYFKQWQPEFYPAISSFPREEVYFFDIIKNEFILNEIGPEKLAFFIEFGIGYTSNARLIESTTNLKYEYDRDNDIWIDTKDGEIMEWKRWRESAVVSLKTGFNLDIFKNLSVGFSAESPKLLLGAINPIGNQQSFGLFKIWSEIKL